MLLHLPVWALTIFKANMVHRISVVLEERLPCGQPSHGVSPGVRTQHNG
ncbi:hypothetical protein DSOL_4886 [Desulfosporosinus metallidurans]|uniref:Uncharacterized protein n=1 Tax=Desulfosporosinus metallidurans TaxID=1888891 RepID=A0A1Q8QHA5_9FIRM|nr:hypothetical protein DSOL_4886 [Desulfosporosinus metallidurans]